jgi:hypothetical protein
MAPIDQGPDARNLEGDAITAVKPEEQKAVDEQASMARKLMLELFDVDPGQHSPGLAAATEAPAIVLHDYVSNDPSRLEAFARRAEQLSHLDGLARLQGLADLRGDAIREAQMAGITRNAPAAANRLQQNLAAYLELMEGTTRPSSLL